MAWLADSQNSIVEVTAFWKTFKLVEIKMSMIVMKWIIFEPSFSSFEMKMMRMTRLEMTLMMN